MFAPYRGHFWVWHVAAAGITAVLVLTGFDWWFFQKTRIDALYPLIMLAGVGGFFVPILLPVGLYIWGQRQKDVTALRAAVATTQAAVVAWIIIAVYKTFTGRIQPEFLTTFETSDHSRNFQFGFFEHGIFWGWPSHHTAVAVAGATVLYLAYRRPATRFVTLAWALIVAAGASVGFHWLSDVVAGAIVGAVVGISIWRATAATQEELLK
jgi:membrane-associated phospholipid phosphatase